MAPWAHLARSKALHHRARSFLRRSGAGAAPPDPAFDELACALARHQADASPAIARLWARRGIAAADAVTADQIPAVPTAAYKRLRVAVHPRALDRARFLTSGTTVGDRGEHAFRTTETYDLSALLHGTQRLHLGGDGAVVVLVPPSRESSLSHMCSLFAGPSVRYGLVGGRIDLAAIRSAVDEARGPVLVLATSFSLVFLLDALAGNRLPLPPGSRVMQTGGYKGKSREVDPPRLREELAAALRLRETDIVSEYGMTELSSQAYEGTLDGGAPWVLVAPPWMRVVPVDPATLEPVPEGDAGILRVVDLANVDSAVAVQTEDLGRLVPGGFELLGRLPGAAPRGCSLAVEELLASG